MAEYEPGDCAKITIKNNGTNPRMYYDANGTRFTVPPRGGVAEVVMKQGDIDNIYWQSEQPDMEGVLELSGAHAKSRPGVSVPNPKLADPNAPVGSPERARAEEYVERPARHAPRGKGKED